MLPIAQLLQPFVSRELLPEQLQQIQLYLDLLLKWNAKISLTAVRNPEEIVRRHFGESLFAGEHLKLESASSLADLGSGAGFPGLPIKILAPQLHVTLIESQQKKATFLREVIRTLEMKNAFAHAGRGEDLELRAQIVTMRAVERFEAALPTAASLVEPAGKLALLIGAAQSSAARNALPNFDWQNPIAIPESRERILLIGISNQS
jgi:16S rRNA (guanine527-N7)-methyltransferase